MKKTTKMVYCSTCKYMQFYACFKERKEEYRCMKFWIEKEEPVDSFLGRTYQKVGRWLSCNGPVLCEQINADNHCPHYQRKKWRRFRAWLDSGCGMD